MLLSGSVEEIKQCAEQKLSSGVFYGGEPPSGPNLLVFGFVAVHGEWQLLDIREGVRSGFQSWN